MQNTAGILGLIAGGGDLPVRLAEYVTIIGRDIFIVRLDGFADIALGAYPGIDLSIGQFGKCMKSLKAAGCTEVVFAGDVKRPDFSKIKLDAGGMQILPKVMKAAGKGDDALLRVFVNHLETEGFTVIGAHSIYQDLLCPRGQIGHYSPTKQDMEDLHKAMRVAQKIGEMDIGQGAIICRGLVLAIEAQEGTDKMLERCADLPKNIRGSETHRKGVLVKYVKPNQDKRIDLPTFGVKTIEGIAKAGLAGIGVGANSTLLLDKEAVIAYANNHGVFVYGLDIEDLG